MAGEQELQQLEILCKRMYESNNSAERVEAEKALVTFQNSPESLPKCQQLLERSQSPFAQLLATNTLIKLVTKSGGNFTVSEKLEMRNYVLRYLGTRPNLESFVSQALVTLFARITKLGWFDCDSKDDFVFRNFLPDISSFLQASVDLCVIGVQLLSALVSEINQLTDAEANRSLTKHRKTVASFRDLHLLEIFQLSCNLLRSALNSSGDRRQMKSLDSAHHGLMQNLLKLAYACLTFDFIGTSVDESSDDLSTVQIPTNWRPAFMDPSTLQLFFDLYAALPNTISPMALSCLVQLASVRRSLFNNAERAKFLNSLVKGVRGLLDSPEGLSDPNNYHEFCRLLARLKSNYQLGELVVVDNYPEFIQSIASFTIQSLQMWQFAPNSLHYLLSLWQRMVASVPYAKAPEPHLLDTYTPAVTKAYITSRLEAVPIIVRDGLEDPLEDLSLIQQQLDQLSSIARCEYLKTCSLTVTLFDSTAARYGELLGKTNLSPDEQLELRVQEGQLSWLVYIIGACVGGRVSFNVADEHDAADGELCCRVLQLMALTDARLGEGRGARNLELALLSFMEAFRKIYLVEQVQKTSKVYVRLSDTLGLHDELTVLSVIVRKIITNLRYWGACELIVSQTLTLFSNLAVGYTSVRKLIRLEECQFLLSHHNAEHFPFLGTQVPISEMRCRTSFYTSLGKLLTIDFDEDESRFDTFFLPIQNSMDRLTSDEMSFNSEEARRILIGLARDLRGVAFAFNTKPAFNLLWDWFYPAYTAIFIRALELWFHDPMVTTPVLKLFCEMCANRSQRLQFDCSSPSGILLFREASKVLCTYGSRVLTIGDLPKDQLYPAKLKGISVCFSMLKSALCGNYVNFGVFRLYGDDALENALAVFIKLLLAVPQSDLLSYPKLSQTYYVLLDCLAQDHMPFIASLDVQVFLYILSTVSEGLTSLDTTIGSSCCSSLDHILSFIYRHSPLGKPVSSSNPVRKIRLQSKGDQSPPPTIAKLLDSHEPVLQGILSTVLQIIMFEDCRNQWAMSRPLLVLILLNQRVRRFNFIGLRPPSEVSYKIPPKKGFTEEVSKIPYLWSHKGPS
ncbi:unnamed protein product [Cyprideis torosa]|uniref:Uncharacterized protein n=1 Tax=Cyprideis torosa TaxID=163714 RepID=A0A7R8ZI97_9CRUS|nr:unnamed protein product [Cyprideis torosa]CAG0884315.1 unnamed protein product [Cyprideis torosa]